MTVRASLFVGANDHAATTHAHRIPLPTSMTTAIRPLRRNGTGGTLMLILRNRQAIYFSAQGWTGFFAHDPICPTGSFRMPHPAHMRLHCACDLSR
ncbi:hypothetical protein [Bradyrhizobium sp. SZCCHNR1047]|uniref:hypothetical protein n=1 Tax=Bradyrhizobium sp. SZCCHNR1047 TaxID=3057354 RepID=UPI002916A123|nr:hypothetical protein [Bradyrhizobium sp. SZCCHNR1047]